MFIWDTRLLTMNHCSLHFYKIHIKKFMKQTSSYLAAVFVMLNFDRSWGSLAWTDWLNKLRWNFWPPTYPPLTFGTVEYRPSEKKIVFGFKVPSIDDLGLILWLKKWFNEL